MALPTIHTKHQYVVGIALTLAGVFGVLGSVTGNLAPMIAALFAPQYLQNASGSNAPTTVSETETTSNGTKVSVGSGGVVQGVPAK